MQPGKPQGFGTIGPDSTPIFTLPGNPVSSYVSFEVFVRPVIRRMLGVEPLHRPMVPATAWSADVAARQAAVRARLARRGRGPVRRPAGRRPRLAPGRRAGARQRLIVVPEDVTEVPEGGAVEVMVLERRLT